jgi:hypothetical protein
MQIPEQTVMFEGRVDLFEDGRSGPASSRSWIARQRVQEILSPSTKFLKASGRAKKIHQFLDNLLLVLWIVANVASTRQTRS